MEEVTKTFYKTSDCKLYESKFLAERHESYLRLTDFLLMRPSAQDLPYDTIFMISKHIADNHRTVRKLLDDFSFL